MDVIKAHRTFRKLLPIGAIILSAGWLSTAEARPLKSTQTVSTLAPSGFSRSIQQAERERGLYSPNSADAGSCPAEDVVPYTNPTVDESLEQPPTATSDDQVTVPEGLWLEGDLCRSRPTVIYVHGWTIDGSAEDFIAPTDWQAAGFNTFIFRWHRDSFDANSPYQPEQRIWNSAGEKFVTAYKDLLTSLGSTYALEVRIVGHSLGTQMATYLTYALASESYPQTPNRTELLDPYIGPGAILPTDTDLKGPPGSGVLLHSVVPSMVKYLADRGTVLIDYSSITGLTVVPVLRELVPTQQMSPRWTEASTTAQHLEDLHVNMRPYYFTGITQPQPQSTDTSPYAFSALTTSEEILANPFLKYYQNGGLETIEVGDDVYAPVERYPREGVGSKGPRP